MNYNKIKELAEEKRITIPQIAEKIGVSKAGLYVTLNKKTLSVAVLEKISETLDVSVNIFFDLPDSQINSPGYDINSLLEENESLSNMVSKLNKENEYLSKINNAYNEQISILKEVNEIYRNERKIYQIANQHLENSILNNPSLNESDRIETVKKRIHSDPEYIKHVEDTLKDNPDELQKFREFVKSILK